MGMTSQARKRAIVASRWLSGFGIFASGNACVAISV